MLCFIVKANHPCTTNSPIDPWLDLTKNFAPNSNEATTLFADNLLTLCHLTDMPSQTTATIWICPCPCMPLANSSCFVLYLCCCSMLETNYKLQWCECVRSSFWLALNRVIKVIWKYRIRRGNASKCLKVYYKLEKNL